MISIISLWYRHCKQSEQDWADAPTASENTGLQTSRVVLKCFEITENLEEIRPRPNNDQNQPKSIKLLSIHENPPKCIKNDRIPAPHWSHTLSSCSRLVRSVSWKMSRHCPSLSDMSGMEEMKETRNTDYHGLMRPKKGEKVIKGCLGQLETNLIDFLCSQRAA